MQSVMIGRGSVVDGALSDRRETLEEIRQTTSMSCSSVWAAGPGPEAFFHETKSSSIVGHACKNEVS